MAPSPRIAELLHAGVAAGASDWHLDAGKRPAWRVDGRLGLLDEPLLSDADLQSLLASAGVRLPTGDTAFRFAGELFRMSYGSTREGATVVLRHVPRGLPSLRDLRVPPRFLEILGKGHGMVLVSGATGSGKSTTLNACIAHLNQQGEGLTITILGDPVEYYHVEHAARIRHLEFGKDFTEWSDILERSLRQDPDVICISELRSAKTMALALSAAETGHLVLATLHNPTAKDAVTRILDTCTDSDRDQQRAITAKALRAVLAQQLVPSCDGRRTAAFELLVNTEAVSNLIRERRFKQIDDEIVRGKRHGMVAMNESLRELQQAGVISRETALDYALDGQRMELNQTLR